MFRVLVYPSTRRNTGREINLDWEHIEGAAAATCFGVETGRFYGKARFYRRGRFGGLDFTRLIRLRVVAPFGFCVVRIAPSGPGACFRNEVACYSF